MTDAARSGTSFRVLRHRDFALCWSGSMVSATGSWMQNVTVPFVIYRMTDSTTWLGFSVFMSFIGATIAAPIGGSLADRHSRRWILVVTLVLLAGCAFAVWGVWISGVATPGIIVAIVAVSGFVAGINMSSWQAFIPQLVDADELADAVRLNSTQFTAARAIGPACAGLVLETLGPGAAFFLNGLSYTVIIAAVLAVHARPQGSSSRERSLFGDFRDGIGFVRRRQFLVVPIVMTGMASLFGTSVVQLAPALAEDVFGVGRGAYGLLVAAFGFGAVAGVVMVSIVSDRFVPSASARHGMVGLALTVVALGVAPVYGIGLVVLFAMGVVYMIFATALATSVQSRVADAYRGRVVAVYFSSLVIGVPVGALIQGMLATVFNLRLVVVSSGVLLLACACFVIGRYDRLRMLDHLAAEELVGEAS